MIKNVKLNIVEFVGTSGIEYKYCDCFFEYTNFKDDLIGYKYLFCNKNYQHKFDNHTNFLIMTTVNLFNYCK